MPEWRNHEDIITARSLNEKVESWSQIKSSPPYFVFIAMISQKAMVCNVMQALDKSFLLRSYLSADFNDKIPIWRWQHSLALV